MAASDALQQQQTATATTSTRSSTNVWLVGQMIPCVSLSLFNQLPTAGQVLRRLYYDLKIKKQTLPTSCPSVIDEVLEMWSAAHIDTTQKPNAVAKLKNLYATHVKVGKNKTRRSEAQCQLENEFTTLLTKLFDISHANCEQKIKIPEDYQFLMDQHEARKMVMAGEDNEFQKREEKKQKRKHDEIRRREKANEDRRRQIQYHC